MERDASAGDVVLASKLGKVVLLFMAEKGEK